jgi:hypothetical protein
MGTMTPQMTTAQLTWIREMMTIHMMVQPTWKTEMKTQMLAALLVWKMETMTALIAAAQLAAVDSC